MCHVPQDGTSYFRRRFYFFLICFSIMYIFYRRYQLLPSPFLLFLICFSICIYFIVVVLQIILILLYLQLLSLVIYGVYYHSITYDVLWCCHSPFTNIDTSCNVIYTDGVLHYIRYIFGHISKIYLFTSFICLQRNLIIFV